MTVFDIAKLSKSILHEIGVAEKFSHFHNVCTLEGGEIFQKVVKS